MKFKLILKNHLSLLVEALCVLLALAGLGLGLGLGIFNNNEYFLFFIGLVPKILKDFIGAFKVKKSQEFLAALDKKFELSKEVEKREKQAIKTLTKKVKAENKIEKHSDNIKDILN